jgi:two-component system chemotaxis response regulator CheY
MKLLIADDSLLMRKAIERALQDKCEIVGRAADGEEALKLFTEQLPDLVTLDISMPKMDGISCLRKMLQIKADAKILMVSSQSDGATAQEAMNLGAKAIVNKPFTSEALRAQVDALSGS